MPTVSPTGNQAGKDVLLLSLHHHHLHWIPNYQSVYMYQSKAVNNFD